MIKVIWLQWCYMNECISIHSQLDCLFNSMFRQQHWTKKKIESSVYWPFMKATHQWQVDSPHKGQVTRKVFPWHNILMLHQENVGTLFGCHNHIINFKPSSTENRVFYKININSIAADALAPDITRSSAIVTAWMLTIYGMVGNCLPWGRISTTSSFLWRNNTKSNYIFRIPKNKSAC